MSPSNYAANGGEVAPALDGIDLTVEGGRTTALVGRSGSGKSTLMSLIPRLYDPTSGRVLIDGADLREISIASLRRAVSVVSQEVMLFDDTVRANIAFGSGQMRIWTPSRRRRGMRQPMISSPPFPKAMIPASAPAAHAFREASASACRSPAPS